MAKPATRNRAQLSANIFIYGNSRHGLMETHHSRPGETQLDHTLEDSGPGVAELQEPVEDDQACDLHRRIVRLDACLDVLDARITLLRRDNSGDSPHLQFDRAGPSGV